MRKSRQWTRYYGVWCLVQCVCDLKILIMAIIYIEQPQKLSTILMHCKQTLFECRKWILCGLNTQSKLYLYIFSPTNVNRTFSYTPSTSNLQHPATGGMNYVAKIHKLFILCNRNRSFSRNIMFSFILFSFPSWIISIFSQKIEAKINSPQNLSNVNLVLCSENYLTIMFF